MGGAGGHRAALLPESRARTGSNGVCVTHNLLRVALLHFSQPRLARVLGARGTTPASAPPWRMAVESDVWQKRAEFAARRVRDDDWLFEKFNDSCQV